MTWAMAVTSPAPAEPQRTQREGGGVAKLMSLIGDRAKRKKSKKIINVIIIKIYYFLILYVVLISRP